MNSVCRSGFSTGRVGVVSPVERGEGCVGGLIFCLIQEKKSPV